MAFFKYLKNSIWDLLLCLIMITGICINVFQGFYLPDYLQANVAALVALAACLCVVLFIAAYNKKTIVLAIVLAVIAFVFAVIYWQNTVLNLEGGIEQTGLIFFVIVVLLSLATFISSRTKTGALLLAVLGSIIICTIVFMEYEHFLWGYFIFIIAAVTMLFYRSYRHNVLHTDTRKVALSGFTGIAAALVVLVLSLSVFVSAVIIEPLALPTRELKLFTHYLSFEILELSGTSSKVILPDDEKKSQNTDDGIKTSKTPGEEDLDKTEYREVRPTAQNKDTSTLNHSNLENFLYAIRYTLREIPPVLLILLLPCLIIAAVLTKIILRKRWYHCTLAKGRKQQVKEFYLYYLRKFEVLSYRRPRSATPQEWAEKISDKLRGFADGDADIINLTKVFVKVNYGDLEVSDEEYGLFLRFHKKFYKGCRDKLGMMKYCRKFFAL